VNVSVRYRLLVLGLAVLAGLIAAFPAAAAHNGDEHSENIDLVANSPRTSAVSQSDLAFWDNLLFAGNYDGFRVIDISDPENAVQLADVKCRGQQSDISVWGNLVFLSIDRPTVAKECSPDTPPGVNGFEGIRIFDVSDPAAPRFVTAVPTDCGSHTHTLLPDLRNGRVLLYVSSYPSGFLGPTPFGTTCRQLNPDGTQGHSKISIVEVPLDSPEGARVIGQPTFELSDFRTPGLRGCHDIQVFLELRIAAAACLSEGQLWDISDLERPRTTNRIFNDAVDIWHSAAFTWDGETVVFGDEFEGGAGPGCQDPNDLIGRIWFYDRLNPVAPLGSYKIPRPQGNQICTMHNFNILPMGGRDILVAASNMGGTTVVDFTNPAAPIEIAYYDSQNPATSSPWSSYWYNGFIYANDRARGVDVLRLRDPASAGAFRFPYFNPQTQEAIIRGRAVDDDDDHDDDDDDDDDDED
jgi:hypothetical protein